MLLRGRYAQTPEAAGSEADDQLGWAYAWAVPIHMIHRTRFTEACFDQRPGVEYLSANEKADLFR